MLSNVESKAIDSSAARDSLEAVREVETHAAHVPIPWGMITVTGIVFGLGISLMLDGKVWGMLALLASLALIMVLEFSNKKAVRTAMKQDVQADQGGWSWKRFLTFMVLYAVAYIGMQVYWECYPEGNVTVSVVVGIIAAAVMIAGYGLMWRKYY